MWSVVAVSQAHCTRNVYEGCCSRCNYPLRQHLLGGMTECNHRQACNNVMMSYSPVITEGCKNPCGDKLPNSRRDECASRNGYW